MAVIEEDENRLRGVAGEMMDGTEQVAELETQAWRMESVMTNLRYSDRRIPSHSLSSVRNPATVD